MITVENLVKSYGRHRVLHGINHAQQKGQAVVLIGPSGCGKSTFLRCLNQLESIDSGRISIGGITVEPVDGRSSGADREKQRQLRMRAGMVFQSFNLFPHLTVLGNITEAPITVKGLAAVIATGVLDALTTQRLHFHSTMLVDRLGNSPLAEGDASGLAHRLHEQAVVLTSSDLYYVMAAVAAALILLIFWMPTRIFPPRAPT